MPATARLGYWLTETGVSANQPANNRKESDSTLPVDGKLNDTDTITSGSGLAAISRKIVALQEVLARLDEHRQHDEEVSRHEGSHERVAAAHQNLAGLDRRQGRDESRQHP